MGWRFNPPPGWPTPPEGFVPPPGWQPDPSWPPAPPQWVFWLDDATGAPAPSAPADGPPPAATPAPTDPERFTLRQRWQHHRGEVHQAHALAGWQVEQDRLDALARAARSASGPGGGSGDGMVLGRGESELWSGPGALVETRRQRGEYVGGYRGVSFRVAKGMRYSVGGTRGHYVPGPEVQTPVDTGRLVVTNRRVVFTGAKSTRQWAFDKLISLDASSDGDTVLIHVSNRQKASGVHVRDHGEDFTAFLALGVALAQNDPTEVATDCEKAAAEHRTERPAG